MRKRDLLADNRRLVVEVSYLRGRIEELQTQPAEIVAQMRGLVGDTLGAFLPQMTPEPTYAPTPMAVPGDWTDQLAPRTMDADELADLERDLNDRLVIADELDRDP